MGRRVFVVLSHSKSENITGHGYFSFLKNGDLLVSDYEGHIRGILKIVGLESWLLDGQEMIFLSRLFHT